MELKEFINQLLRNWIFILVFAFFGLAGAFFFNQNQKEVFQASLLLYLRPAGSTKSQGQSSADNYYGQLRVQEFSDSLIAFLLQPEVQNEVGKKFQIKKLTPQILRLTVEEEEAESVKTSILKVKEAIMGETQKISQEENFFQVENLTSSPILEKTERHKTLDLVVGLFLGLAVAILAISFKIYFYPKQK